MGQRPKIERRHREAEAHVREWLRTTYVGHANPQVTSPREVSEATGIYLSTVSTIMTYLAKDVAGTGLTQLKPGTYEYIWIEDTLAQPPPEPESDRHPKPRRMPAYEYMEAHKGRVRSLSQIAKAINGPVSSVANVMKEFAAQPDELVPIKAVGSGLYIWPLTEAERKAQEAATASGVLAGLTGPAPAPNGSEPVGDSMEEPVTEPEIKAAIAALTPERVHAAVEVAPQPPVPQAVLPQPDPADLTWLAQPQPQPPWAQPSWPQPAERWVERVAQMSDGTWLAKDSEGKAYKLVPL